MSALGEPREAYVLTAWMRSKLIKEICATRSREELRTLAQHIAQRYAPNEEWMATNDAELEPIRRAIRAQRVTIARASQRRKSGA